MQSLKAKLEETSQMLRMKMTKTHLTEDIEFDAILAKFNKLEKCTQDASKHIQQLIENFHAMTATMDFIGEDFREAGNTTTRMQKAAEKLESVHAAIEDECVKLFQDATLEQIITPISEYIVQFSPIRQLISQRNKLLRDYDLKKERVKGLTEKQNNDPLALPRAKEAMNKAKEEYDVVNSEAKQQMQDVIANYEHSYENLLDNLVRQLQIYFAKLHACSK